MNYMCTFYTVAKIDEKLVLENVLCVLAYFVFSYFVFAYKSAYLPTYTAILIINSV